MREYKYIVKEFLVIRVSCIITRVIRGFLFFSVGETDGSAYFTIHSYTYLVVYTTRRPFSSRVCLRSRSFFVRRLLLNVGRCVTRSRVLLDVLHSSFFPLFLYCSHVLPSFSFILEVHSKKTHF